MAEKEYLVSKINISIDLPKYTHYKYCSTFLKVIQSIIMKEIGVEPRIELEGIKNGDSDD